CTDVADWLPSVMTAKAAFIPHLSGIVTSNAFGALTRDCFNHAMRAPVDDIAQLAPILPAVCRQTFEENFAFCQSLHGPEEDLSWTATCAVSLLGWSPTFRRFIGLRFA